MQIIATELSTAIATMSIINAKEMAFFEAIFFILLPSDFCQI